MRRLEKLLEDTLERATGHRTTEHARNNREPTELEIKCGEVGRKIYEARKEIKTAVLDRIDAEVDMDLILVGSDDLFVICEEEIIEEIDGWFEEDATITRIKEFIEPALDAMKGIIYAFLKDKDYDMTPEELEEKKERAIEIAIKLSEYPGKISAEVKNMIFRYVDVMQDDDISVLFDGKARTVLNAKQDANPSIATELKRLRYCPATEVVPLFGELVFETFIGAYRKVHEIYRDETGRIPRKKINLAKDKLVELVEQNEVVAAYELVKHLL